MKHMGAQRFVFASPTDRRLPGKEVLALAARLILFSHLLMRMGCLACCYWCETRCDSILGLVFGGPPVANNIAKHFPNLKQEIVMWITFCLFERHRQGGGIGGISISSDGIFSSLHFIKITWRGIRRGWRVVSVDKHRPAMVLIICWPLNLVS